MLSKHWVEDEALQPGASASLTGPLVLRSGPGTCQLAEVGADTAVLPVLLGSAGDQAQGHHQSSVSLVWKPDKTRVDDWSNAEEAWGLPACHDAHWALLGHLSLPVASGATASQGADEALCNPEAFLLSCMILGPETRVIQQVPSGPAPGSLISSMLSPSPSEAANSLPYVCILALTLLICWVPRPHHVLRL